MIPNPEKFRIDNGLQSKEQKKLDSPTIQPLSNLFPHENHKSGFGFTFRNIDNQKYEYPNEYKFPNFTYLDEEIFRFFDTHEIILERLTDLCNLEHKKIEVLNTISETLKQKVVL